MKLSCACALSNGLHVEMISLTNERSRKSGGKHLHSVFPLRVSLGSVNVTTNIAYECLNALERDSLKKFVIKRTDLFFIEETGMLSKQLCAALDTVLQVIIGNSQPWGGKLVIFIGDAKQLPPISDQPVWSAPVMSTIMKVIVFMSNVRARDLDLRYLNEQCRCSFSAAEADTVADNALSRYTVVPTWVNVPDDAVRVVSTRAVESDICGTIFIR
jgi:hypothetical protein